MAITRHATSVWEGDLPTGKGNIALASGAFKGPYSFKTRFESEPGTNPEELIAAAHSACFSMALSHMLASGGHKPTSVSTTADVVLDKVGEGFKIVKIVLHCQAKVPGIDAAAFDETAKKAKAGCPISQALAATPIELDAKLV